MFRYIPNVHPNIKVIIANTILKRIKLKAPYSMTVKL